MMSFYRSPQTPDKDRYSNSNRDSDNYNHGYRPDNIQNKLRELDEQEEERRLMKLVRLSRRKISLAVFLGLIPIPFSSFFPYIYTRRWWQMLGFIAGALLLSFTVFVSEEDEDKASKMAMQLVMIYAALVSPIDNGLAIARARERLNDLSR